MIDNQNVTELQEKFTAVLEQHHLGFKIDTGGVVIVADKLKLLLLRAEDVLNDQLDGSGIQVVLYEDQFSSHPDIVISRIKSLVGVNNRIHGRETTVEELSQTALDAFLNENHLLGTAKARHRYGLLHKGVIAAVAAFGRSCPIDFEGETYKSNELIRFCARKGFTVVGGLSRLIKYFERTEQPEHLMTYIDKEWSNGQAYEKLGFRIVAETPPVEFYISPQDGRRYRKPDLKFSMSSEEIENLSWRKVKNLGNYKFVKILVKK